MAYKPFIGAYIFVVVLIVVFGQKKNCMYNGSITLTRK